ncbi:MAG: hypothetical protein CW338_03285 [Clostridiales bacterium]|nr:hypothetical protein [Clostridiales bacterium]
MKLIDWLERKLGKFYVTGLMNYLIIGIGAVYLMDLFGLNASVWLRFSKPLILQGQVWRVLTFILVPTYTGIGNLIQQALILYFWWFVGTTLENSLGSRRFFLYYLIGTVLDIICGFVFGDSFVALLTYYPSNYYLHFAMFFGFALLYGEQRMLLFFFIPVKSKWIALADGIFYLYLIVNCFTGAFAPNWSNFALILVSLVPIVLFFPYDLKLLFRSVRSGISRLIIRLRNR